MNKIMICFKSKKLSTLFIYLLIYFQLFSRDTVDSLQNLGFPETILDSLANVWVVNGLSN
jgi:hypothetical protein